MLTGLPVAGLHGADPPNICWAFTAAATLAPAPVSPPPDAATAGAALLAAAVDPGTAGSLLAFLAALPAWLTVVPLTVPPTAPAGVLALVPALLAAGALAALEVVVPLVFAAVSVDVGTVRPSGHPRCWRWSRSAAEAPAPAAGALAGVSPAVPLELPVRLSLPDTTRDPPAANRANAVTDAATADISRCEPVSVDMYARLSHQASRSGPGRTSP